MSTSLVSLQEGEAEMQLKVFQEKSEILVNCLKMAVQRSKTYVAPVKFDSKSEVCYTAGSVLFYQDVFALQVSVCDGWFALSAVDLSVQMTEAWYGGVGQFQQSFDI